MLYASLFVIHCGVGLFWCHQRVATPQERLIEKDVFGRRVPKSLVQIPESLARQANSGQASTLEERVAGDRDEVRLILRMTPEAIL